MGMTNNWVVSAWTGLAYPAAGLALYGYLQTPESAVFAAALALLGFGTWAFHIGDWQEWESDADHAGMNAVYLTLATFAATGSVVFMVVAFIGALYIEYVRDHPNRVLMGFTVFLTFGAGFQQRPTLALAGFALMAAGFAAWGIREQTPVGPVIVTPDLSHGLWHLGTAIGTPLLYLAVV